MNNIFNRNNEYAKLESRIVAAIVGILFVLSSALSLADTPHTPPNAFSNGQPIDADEMNANFENIYQLINDIYRRVAPPGTIYPFAGNVIPDNYLECNGQAVNRADYPELFSAIGTMYGEGDGQTTFNLPDYRGMFLRGWDHGSAKDPDAASRTDRGDGTTGDNVGTKQGDMNKIHGHSVKSLYVAPNRGSRGLQMSDYSNEGTNNWQHQWRSQFIGASGGNESRPKNVNVLYIIRK